MSIRNNYDRMSRAKTALEAYLGDDRMYDLVTEVQDLICDLFHLVAEEDTSISTLLRRALMHFSEERSEEDQRVPKNVRELQNLLITLERLP